MVIAFAFLQSNVFFFFKLRVILVRIFPHSNGLNTERYGVSFHIQPKRGKIRTRITPNTDTFHPVFRARIIPEDLIFRKLQCGLSEITIPIKFVLRDGKKVHPPPPPPLCRAFKPSSSQILIQIFLSS